MAVAATVINGSGLGELLTTNLTSYAFSSFTITSGRPTLAIIQSAENDPSHVPALDASGHGSTYTWTNEASLQMDGGVRRRLTVFSCLPGSTTTGVLTATFDLAQFNCSLHMVEFTGADNTDIIRQAVTNFGSAFGTVTVTMGAFGQASNATFGIFCINNTTATLTAGTGFTGLTSLGTSEVEAPDRTITQFRTDNDTTVTADISGAVNRRWIGIGLEIKESPATNTINAVTATATADAIVPVPKATLTAVASTATGVALVASIPVAYVPTGILGDVAIKGPALFGNFVLGNSGAPPVVTAVISGVVATASAEAIIPVPKVSAVPPVATAIAGFPDDMPVLTVTVLATAVATALGVSIIPVVKVTETAVVATATGVANVPTLATSTGILAIAANAFAVAPIPVPRVGVSGVTATATAAGITVTLSVALGGAVAEAVAEAPVPAVNNLETAVSGDLNLRAILHERLVLDTVISETLNLRPIIHERCKLEASMKQVTSGQAVTYTGTFEVDDVRTDPTTITLQVREPDGTTTEYTYLNATITKDGTGVFSKDIVHDVEGTWKAKMVGTGTCRASDIESVLVKQDPFS